MAPRELKEPKASGPKRVLVVDDDADAAGSITMLLRLLGHDAREACDGPTALTVLGEFVPDLLILDIGLPGMDGYEVARRVRSRHELGDVHLVALSGFDDEKHRNACETAGFDGYVVKPIALSEIEDLLAAT